MRTQVLLLTVLAMSASAANAGNKSKDKPVKAVGEPISCVTTHQIRSTSVVDNKTIDFKMKNGDVLRNKLSHSCPGLDRDEAFSYRLSTSRLCSVDIITVLENYGNRLQNGASCGLGKFQKVVPDTDASQAD